MTHCVIEKLLELQRFVTGMELAWPNAAPSERPETTMATDTPMILDERFDASCANQRGDVLHLVGIPG